MRLDTFDGWRDYALSAVRDQQIEAGEDWAPVLLAQHANGEHNVVLLPGELMGTAQMPLLLDQLLGSIKPTFFALVFSAWAAPAGPPEGLPACETCKGEGMMRGSSGGLVACPSCRGRGGPAQDLSQHPQRQEIVSVTIGSQTEVEYHVAMIYRPHPKKRPKLGPWEKLDDVGGRMMNALRRPT